MSEVSPTSAKNPVSRSNTPVSVVIRSYSDVIYLYPSLLMSIICGLWVTIGEPTPADPGATSSPSTVCSRPSPEAPTGCTSRR